MILSGTASGVIGAGYIAELCGVERCMSLDIGGTSADVALIIDGKPQYGVGEHDRRIPDHIPSVSVSSIGEGGGSIAWVDSSACCKVGPESAGSTPGPACYGRGGTRADHHRCVRRLRPDRPCRRSATARVTWIAAARAASAGWRRRSAAAWRRPPRRSSASPSPACMPRSARWSRASGIDPRELSCLAFGGAGPMLGCFLARELGMAGGRGATDARRAERARRPDRRPEERLHRDALCRSRVATAAVIRTGFAMLKDGAMKMAARSDAGLRGATLRYRPSCASGANPSRSNGARCGYDEACDVAAIAASSTASTSASTVTPIPAPPSRWSRYASSSGARRPSRNCHVHELQPRRRAAVAPGRGLARRRAAPDRLSIVAPAWSRVGSSPGRRWWRRTIATTWSRRATSRGWTNTAISASRAEAAHEAR